ncbi:histone chaperone rtt106-like [Cryptomeria japonica]|uniref:histone chaperone rtt106-like n=1 Tax=Cryptomeria japonica TaxID=3369 RepID=UPI0027D9F13C|nr:histone chaperone rtt106-like [Cryptomeria japonica]
MKQFPESSSDEEDDEGPMGKRSESRTNNKQDTQESIPISSIKSKGKAPRYKFTVKGPKGGESSFASQEAQHHVTEENALEELEREKEEGEIQQEKEMHDVEDSIPPIVDNDDDDDEKDDEELTYAIS